MTGDALPDSVVAVIRHLFPGYSGPVTANLTAADVNGWDSLRHSELILCLEDALGVEFDAMQAFEAPNLGAVIASRAEPDRGD